MTVARDLSKGVIVVFSGGPWDWTNPQDVRDRMDQIIKDVNADAYVQANTAGKGLTYQLIEDQPDIHIHQSEWRQVLANPVLLAASPLILIGHSYGGAAVMDLAHSLFDLGRTVDLAFTADSVATPDDYGEVYGVPPNVTLNLNSYTIPVYPAWLLAPFPHGEKNYRQPDDSLSGILNFGLPFVEGGAFAHHDAFYDVAGGNLKDDTYQYPELIRDCALAVLKGASNDEVFRMARASLQVLADKKKLRIPLDGEGVETTLELAAAHAVK